jgi:hypothetical protein
VAVANCSPLPFNPRGEYGGGKEAAIEDLEGILGRMSFLNIDDIC